jgi:hypothetical protein
MNEAQRTAAAATWQAYNAMETTKRRHFDYLSLLESRSKNIGLQPSGRENDMLAQLLRDHDKQVKDFKTASQALRESDPAAFAALWAYIQEINAVLAPLPDREVH